MNTKTKLAKNPKFITIKEGDQTIEYSLMVIQEKGKFLLYDGDGGACFPFGLGDGYVLPNVKFFKEITGEPLVFESLEYAVNFLKLHKLPIGEELLIEPTFK